MKKSLKRSRRTDAKRPLGPGAALDRIEAARPKAVVPALLDRARGLLSAALLPTVARTADPASFTSMLSVGLPAARIGEADSAARAAEAPEKMASAACVRGCAFCCILNDEASAPITEFEARRLHAALTGLAHRPDGRDWHPKACAALDPATRECRAYEARPVICRSYHSDDALACEAISRGEARPGPWVLGGYPIYLAVQAIIREALKGVERPRVYSLARLARAATDGLGPDEALSAARLPSRALDLELERARR